MRRLLAHVRNLPMDSALVKRLRGEQAHWTWETELAAANFDALQRLTYYTLLLGGQKDAKEPKPYPRPGAYAPPPPKPVTLSGFASFISEE